MRVVNSILKLDLNTIAQFINQSLREVHQEIDVKNVFNIVMPLNMGRQRDNYKVVGTVTTQAPRMLQIILPL